MYITKVRVDYLFAERAKELLSEILREKGYEAILGDGFVTEMDYSKSIIVAHKSNYDRLKRWKSIEKEFHERCCSLADEIDALLQESGVEERERELNAKEAELKSREVAFEELKNRILLIDTRVRNKPSWEPAGETLESVAKAVDDVINLLGLEGERPEWDEWMLGLQNGKK